MTDFQVKEAALTELRSSRERVLRHLGPNQIGERLARLDPTQAGALANDLLALLDAVDRVLTRARRLDAR